MNYNLKIINTIKVESSDWVEFTTDKFGRKDSNIKYYVKQMNDLFILSDGGYLLDNIASSTYNKMYKEKVDKELYKYQIELKDNVLITEANNDSFYERRNSLVKVIEIIDKMPFRKTNRLRLL